MNPKPTHPALARFSPATVAYWVEWLDCKGLTISPTVAPKTLARFIDRAERDVAASIDGMIGAVYDAEEAA